MSKHVTFQIALKLAAAVGLSLSAGTAAANTCTWSPTVLASDSTYHWSNSSNWTGGGCSTPGASDSANFTSGAVGCNIDVAATVGTFTVSTTYTGIITQNGSLTVSGNFGLSSAATFAQAAAVTVTGSFSQSAGTFTGGSSVIKIGGAFNLSGGTFTATTGRMEISGTTNSFNKTGGTFNHNNGRVMLNGTSGTPAFASASAGFYDLTINDSLAGYWSLDDGSGTNATDLSGYGNAGTLSGASWDTTTSDLPSTLAFKNNSAVTFTGTSSVGLGVTSFPALNGAQTVSLWVYYASVPAAQQSFASIASGTNRNQIGFFDNAGARTIRVWKRVGTTDTSLVIASSTPASGWHHIAYTFDGTTHTLYVDGASSTSTTAATSGTPDTATLGKRTDSAEFFGGRIDDVRIYKRALSSADVAQLAAGAQPQTALATQSLSGTPTVADDLVIAAGSLAAGANALTVGGNWWNLGGPFTGTGTVTFNGSATTNVIRSNGQSFGAIAVSGSGTWTLGDALSMSGHAVTVGAGNLVALSYSIRAGYITETGGSFTPGAGTVTLDGGTDVTLPHGTFGGLTIAAADASLLGYWKLDEGTGTSFSDSSGNGNAGTLVSGPTWSTSVPSAMRFSDADSISVTGGADHGQATVTALGLNANTSQYTLAYWMYYASIPTVSGDSLVLSGSSLLQTGFLKNTTGCATAACLAVWNQSGGSTPRAYTTTPPTPGWHHFGYTWDGTNSTLYIDGIQVDSRALAPNAFTVNTVYLSTWDGTHEGFVGKLDDVRIYSSALNATQMLQLAGGYSSATRAPTYTLTGATTVTGACSLTNGGISVGANTLTASSGLNVGSSGSLTLASSSGTVVIGSGQSLVVNGTLNASSTGATITSASGNYAFQVGSTSTATPTLNVSGLRVQNTDTNGMWINANTGASTTFKKFDNIAFSSGTGTQLLQIYAPTLYLTSNGCTFDAGATTATTTYAVTLTGNGTSDATETRALFGGTTCANNWTVGSSDRTCLTVASGTGVTAKLDGDPDGDGVGSAAVNGAAVAQFVRAAATDTAGTLVGFPTAAFDWNTFNYYSTYAAFHNALGGNTDVIYVRDESGKPLYSWTVPNSGETITGTPQWTTIGGTHYLFVATNAGKIYRLIDTGTGKTSGTLTLDAGTAWSTNPFNCSCTISTPLAMDTSNLYWGSTTSGKNFWTLGIADQSNPTPVAITPTVTNTALSITTLGGTSYAFMGVTGNILKISTAGQSITATNNSPGTASVLGRIVVGSNKSGTSRVYAGDDSGTMWSLDSGSGFATPNGLWHYTAADPIKGSPYYDYDTDTVQYGTQGGAIIVLSGTGMLLNPTYPYTPTGGSGDPITAAPLYYQGVLVVGSTGGKLYFLDRNTGTTPGVSLIKQYYFGSTQSVSGIGYDPAVNRYMVTTSSSTGNDGRIYFFDSVTDPTPGAS